MLGLGNLIICPEDEIAWRWLIVLTLHGGEVRGLVSSLMLYLVLVATI